MKEPWDLMAIPSVTFNEERVRFYINQFCRKHKIPCWEDVNGEMWLNIKVPSQIKDSSNVIIANMDHPGIAFNSARKGEWMGKMPFNLIGAKIRLYGGESDFGEISSVNRTTGTVSVKTDAKSAEAGCVWFSDMPEGYKKTQDKIYARAASNLLTVVTILEVLRDNPTFKTPVLFNRSEECCDEGYARLFEVHRLNKKARVIVIDTIEESSNIQIDSGVVIRTGDAQRLYTETMSQRLFDLARTSGVKHMIQRVFSGKAEAASLKFHGYQVGCASIVVRNMHNNGPREDSPPVPEIVSLDDQHYLYRFVKYVMSKGVA